MTRRKALAAIHAAARDARRAGRGGGVETGLLVGALRSHPDIDAPAIYRAHNLGLQAGSR